MIYNRPGGPDVRKTFERARVSRVDLFIFFVFVLVAVAFDRIRKRRVYGGGDGDYGNCVR